MGVGSQRYAPAVLPPGKTRYPLYRRLGGLQGRSGQVQKISPPPGFDPRTVLPVASRYTDWAIPAKVTTFIDEHAVWWDEEGARGAAERKRAENLQSYMATIYKNAHAKAKPFSGFKKIECSMSHIPVAEKRIQSNIFPLFFYCFSHIHIPLATQTYYHLWLPGLKSYSESEYNRAHTVHAIVVVSIYRQQTVLFTASVLTGHRQPKNI